MNAVYFVHSFASIPVDASCRLAECSYGGHEIVAAIRKNKMYGCQFHPEKSGLIGLKILEKISSNLVAFTLVVQNDRKQIFIFCFFKEVIRWISQAMSVLLNQGKVQQQVGLSVMKMAMDVATNQGEQIAALVGESVKTMETFGSTLFRSVD